jgi:Ca-activated chloride channel homolog
LALPSTACSEKQAIKTAIDNLDAGGSTAGGEGILLAYKVAGENLKKDGNNRIILVTDGDFNVGQSTDSDMESLIEQKRKEGIALTVCGFGMGNYKDSKMEILADKGNGNYYYIDNFKESKKVFVTDLVGTLFTIAKDVKIQVEFNPKFVKAYRLIGYENRRMPPQDFNDDTKDAGELGAGHTVTALYEIVPVGSLQNIDGFIDLKYQQPNNKPTLKDYGDELLTVKLRYKKPDSETSKLLERTLANSSQGYDKASQNLRFACGVTAYAMLLRDSKFKGEASYALAKQLLQSTALNIENGYRDELLQLISQTEKLSQ